MGTYSPDLPDALCGYALGIVFVYIKREFFTRPARAYTHQKYTNNVILVYV